MLHHRRETGASQDLILVGVLLVGLYFAAQYLMVHKEPEKLVNKDFTCRKAGGVPAFQNPHDLAAYLRASGVTARFAAPDKAMQNEAERQRVEPGMVDLNCPTPNTPLTETRNPLVVHVMDTYTGEKGLVLARVRVLNKVHKGETWYISADKLNALENVTGFADQVAKMHKPGIDDVLESEQGKKAFEKIGKVLKTP